MSCYSKLAIFYSHVVLLHVRFLVRFSKVYRFLQCKLSE